MPADAASVTIGGNSTSVPEDGGNTASPAATGSACPSTTFTKGTAATQNSVRKSNSGNSDTCARLYYQFDTSYVPDGSTITQVDFKFNVTTVSSPVNCNYMPMNLKPSTNTAATVYADIGNGTAYVSNDTGCKTAGIKTITLGSTANTDLQTLLASDWFSVGVKLTNETRDGTTHTSTLGMTEHTNSLARPYLIVTYTPSNVTIPVQLTSGTGTISPFSANFTVSGQGCVGVLGHNGSPASQSFTCYGGTTITVTRPSASSTTRFLFSDASTSKSFASCNSGTCSTTSYTVYKQYNQTITLTGLDAQTVLVTRTQLGAPGTQAIGTTSTALWADEGTTLSLEDPKSVSATERYDTGNTTSFSVTASATRTALYVHQYQISSITFKDTTGSTLNTQPSAFTWTDSANAVSTAISNSWIATGTSTLTGITWNGLNVTPTANTISITSAGAKTMNTDIGVTSDALFQVATDQATSLTSLSYDSSTAILQFTSDASGTHDTVVEYSTNTFESVRTITVDGVTLTSGFVDSTPGYLEISDTSFSSKTFAIQMNLKSSGGGGGSGGGDSGTGSDGGTDTGSGGQIVDIRVTMPEFTVMPGESVTKKIIVQATGHTKIIITEMAFDSRYASWFAVSSSFPVAIVLLPGQTNIYKEIPLTMTVPENTEFQSLIIPTKVTATIDALPQAVEISQVIKANIGTGPTGVLLGGIDMNLLIVVGLIGLVAAAAYSSSKKRRH